MNDQVAVRVGNRGADFAKKFQTFWDRERLFVAILVDRQPIDVFHHKVRQPVLCRSAVQQSRDVWMIEPRQNLPLVPKMSQHGVSVRAAFDQFDRNLLTILVVGTLGEKHRAHSAATEFANNAVTIDQFSGRKIVSLKTLGRKKAIPILKGNLPISMRLEQ